jgi:hypothetical protein
MGRLDAHPMATDEQIYYLRQALKPADRFSVLSPSAREVSLIAHFYVKAENDSNAGGIAGTFCLEHKLECAEYICLPQVITAAQIGEHEDEQRKAYELALQSGFAVVASVVLTW